MTLRSLLLIALLGAGGLGCEARTHEAPREEAPPPPAAAPTTSGREPDPAPAAALRDWTDALERVRLVGASATGGFRATLTAGGGTDFIREPVELAQVLDAAIAQPHERVTGRSDLLFFAAPIQTGPRLIDETLADDPTMVVAVDFLFWYGYGANDRSGARIASEAARLELLEEGLAQLGRIETPVVVGDFPDMSPAVGLMLSPAQMPRVETLSALNERVYEWAAARENVIVIPLARLVEEMRSDRGFQVGAWSWPAGSATRLLQADQLHPTVDGLVAIGQLVADGLIESGAGLTPANFEHDPEHVLATLVEDLLKERRSP